MITKKGIQISILLLATALSLSAQKLSGIYKVPDLMKRISNSDTTYIVNFWATWCKPCMEELQAIDSVGMENKTGKIKLVFVSLDFRDKKNQVNSALKRKGIQSSCVLLDEVNGNVYINQISPDWSGSIPATLLKKGVRQVLLDKKLSSEQLRTALKKFESVPQ
jgi:thiol-disulfide isomerase/thioredoxin